MGTCLLIPSALPYMEGVGPGTLGVANTPFHRQEYDTLYSSSELTHTVGKCMSLLCNYM